MDRNDDLWLGLSYNKGATWNGAGTVRLVSGFNNAEIPFGETRVGDPVTVPSNPWIVEIPGGATQLMVRVRLEGLEFPEGLVFDTRLWTNPPPPYPAQMRDSGVDFMSHLAVMKLFSIEPFPRVTTIAGPHGLITPANPIASPGADLTFTIEPDPYYRLAELRTNDVPVNGTFDGGPIVFTWSNLVENAILESVFTPNVTSQGTPEWWLAGFGWTNDFETADWQSAAGFRGRGLRPVRHASRQYIYRYIRSIGSGDIHDRGPIS